MRKHSIILIALILSSWLLSSCDQNAPSRERRLKFDISIAEDLQEELIIDFALVNEGDKLTADYQFNSSWKLVQSGGDVRAGGQFLERQQLTSGESAHLLTWSGAVDSGSYSLYWEAPGYGNTLVDFTVRETTNGLLVENFSPQRTFQDNSAD